MDNQQERLFWWFVGFFDGEGWLTMNTRPGIRQELNYTPLIGIANTNFDLIEKCHLILDSYGIGHHVTTHYRRQQHNNKPQKAIQLNGFKRVSKFLDIFGNHINKQKQVSILKEFISYRNSVNRYIPYGDKEV